jgi:hypothetical protein
MRVRRTVGTVAAGLTGACAAVLFAPTGAGAAPGDSCDEAGSTVVVTDADELDGTLAAAAPGTLVVLDTGDLTGEIRVEGTASQDCGTAVAADSGAQPAGAVETAFLTGYSLEDNSPPGTRATSSGRSAGGTGTFEDPITLAVGYAGGDEFSMGTVFYVPFVRAYFVVQDRCGACSEPPAQVDYMIDLWVGSDPDDACMESITGTHTVVRDAGPGWTVDPRPYELGSDCMTYDDSPAAA